jgi:predicted alpha/beta-fold hydrolase
MNNKLTHKNIKTIRLNLRGCGSGKGYAKSMYHCGKSDDILEVLKAIKYESPNSPIILIGFSLGGNLALKLAGELEGKAYDYIEKVIALSPPIDISNSVQRFDDPQNHIYNRYFSNLLKQDIEYMKKKFPDFPNINLPKNMTIKDFNTLFIVPYFGFEDIDDYYRKASSKYVISNIKIPCKILLSEDDPLVSWEIFNEINIPNNVDVFITKNGGHLGYLGKPTDKRGFYWLDNLLLDWIFK